ncbi:hypothetical protein TWF569_000681 [Orbilia oligospora]|uniref:Uncharacterized protein n=1 Tax=Orbilia oligospora TaxID=2813651 RepID=A0A7C8IWF0_ORBOL|nr:hypothetical protein TWF102_003545 [Orbilia oligospora]KAF3082788.1 hypothetical protein TWF103_003098 [Orbilia oligospora]KAF3088683.1 hypothetical protein TWF706_010687 [Orbilia oligospora]KAF3121538.1 hypothetical protein TWF594_003172 [Orbilia oligospora]KAF3125942.1 hypothetical protein TWF569_000681 [Orbilia oligospora]
MIERRVIPTGASYYIRYSRETSRFDSKYRRLTRFKTCLADRTLAQRENTAAQTVVFKPERFPCPAIISTTNGANIASNFTRSIHQAPTLNSKSIQSNRGRIQLLKSLLCA